MNGRYHALDSMRATMMLLGIYLHVVVGYSGNGRWPYIDPHPTPVLDWSLGVIHAFRMPAFFAMAGFFGALLWERRGAAEFASNRARRIVLPFLLFWSAMFPWFYPMAKRLHPLHLWFLEYLILLYAIGALAAATVRAPWIHTAFRWVLPRWYAPLVFAAFSWPVLVAMHGTLKDCDGIMPEPLILAAYVVPFGFGWILYGNRDLLPRFERHIPLYLVLQFFGFLIYGTTSPRTQAPLKAAGNVVLCWCLTFAVLGLFLKFASRPSPRWRYMSDSSYWLYLMHLPVVVGIQFAFAPVPLPAIAKIPIVLAISVVVLLVSYDLVVRATWMGALLNGRRYARGLPRLREAVVAAMVLLSAGVARGQPYTYTEFDIPGAPNAAPTGINNRGQIVLTSMDANRSTRAFLRDPDGTVTEIQIPGINPGGVMANAINNSGQIAGTYRDGDQVVCYIRSAAGEYTRFTGPVFFAPTSINDAGAVAGPGGDVVNVVPGGMGHARSADGVFSEIRAPFFLGGTSAQAINNRGEIAGWGIFGASYSAQHSFFRRPDGTYLRYDVPGTTSHTRIMALNNSGQFAGFFVAFFAGFVGQADGTVDVLPNHPVSAMNDLGEIVGPMLGEGPAFWRPYIGRPAQRSADPEIRLVLTASAFAGAPVIAPGTWIEVYGRNLSATTRAWKEADFSGSTAPTSLDGVSVSIGGARAFVSYVSPSQVNALVPAGVPAGTAKVAVTTGARTSAAYSVPVVESQPGFLCFQADPTPFSSWVAAVFPDFVTFAAPPWYPPSRRVKPGETIILLATGLGPVEPDVPIGRVAPGPSRVTAPIDVYFSRQGVAKATVEYAGLVPGTVGLYQINVVVPDVLYPDLPTDDNVGLTVNVGGKPTLLDARRALSIAMSH